MTAEVLAPVSPGQGRAVPLVDLAWQVGQVADEVAAGFADVLARTSFIGGPQVAGFEQAFAEYCGISTCVGVGNGTDAVELALRACGVGPGDEVVLPTNSFIATAGAVVRAGARPVLVDCDPDHLLIDVTQAGAAVGPRTAALLPVHLFGQQADMPALRRQADSAGVALVEDAAQAQGARRHGLGVGALADAAATSFYPGKNLGAYGDAGAVLTGSGRVADQVRLLRNHGSVAKYEHASAGFNSRLDTMQAVVLLAKLARLETWNELRRSAAARYDALLAGLPQVRTPLVLAGNLHVWHLYAVRVPARDRVLQRLTALGIGAGVHYPVPIHLQPAFAGLGHGVGDFPVAEAAAGELLSLPMYPGITPEQQERVVATLALALHELAP